MFFGYITCIRVINSAINVYKLFDIFTIIDLFHLTWFDHYIDPDKWGGAGRT